MIRLEIDPKSVEAILERTQGIRAAEKGKAVYRGFSRATLLIERALKGNLSGSALNVRSGMLRASIGSRVDVAKGEMTATIGSGARQGARMKYANIQETGGTVTPKRRQYLTVPLDAAKTASGVARFTARDVMRHRTQYDGSFVHDGVIFGYMKRGKYKKSGGLKLDITPLFALKTSVTLPASHYLTRTSQETFADANREILTGIQETLKGEAS